MMQSKPQMRPSAQTTSSASPNKSVKKSLRNIREKSHQEFYNNRSTKLNSIFIQQGFDLNSPVSEEEILNVLDSLGQEPFNREIAEQLFEKLPLHESSENSDERRFILHDFIDTHIKAEYLLLLRAEEIEGELDQVYNQIEALRDEYHEIVRKSDARIENNALQIDIVEVVCDDEDYQAEPGSVFSVILLIGNYKYETEEVTIESTKFNPKFNWSFHLKLDTPDEKVKILLRDQERFISDDDYSDLKCTINLKNYRDQLEHVSWLTLYNSHNQPTKFKVHLVIQWQFSRIAFSEERFNELQSLEEKLTDEKEYIEASIRYLVHPFAMAASNGRRNLPQGPRIEPNVRMTQSNFEDPTRDTINPNRGYNSEVPQRTVQQESNKQSRRTSSQVEAQGYNNPENYARNVQQEPTRQIKQVPQEAEAQKYSNGSESSKRSTQQEQYKQTRQPFPQFDVQGFNNPESYLRNTQQEPPRQIKQVTQEVEAQKYNSSSESSKRNTQQEQYKQTRQPPQQFDVQGFNNPESYLRNTQQEPPRQIKQVPQEVEAQRYNSSETSKRSTQQEPYRQTKQAQPQVEAQPRMMQSYQLEQNLQPTVAQSISSKQFSGGLESRNPFNNPGSVHSSRQGTEVASSEKNYPIPFDQKASQITSQRSGGVVLPQGQVNVGYQSQLQPFNPQASSGLENRRTPSNSSESSAHKMQGLNPFGDNGPEIRLLPQKTGEFGATGDRRLIPQKTGEFGLMGSNSSKPQTPTNQSVRSPFGNPGDMGGFQGYENKSVNQSRTQDNGRYVAEGNQGYYQSNRK